VEHNIACEIATCCNPPTHIFTADRKKTWPIPTGQTNKLFFRTMQGQVFFFNGHILKEGVFVIHLSSNAEICLINRMDNDKLMVHQRKISLFSKSSDMAIKTENICLCKTCLLTFSEYLYICNNKVNKHMNNAYKNSAYIFTYFTSKHLQPTGYLDYSLGSE